jgi:hypothetical protein
MKVTIPWDKPVQRLIFTKFQGIENQDPLFFLLVLSPKDGARARKKWVKMRRDAHATFRYPVSQSIKATSGNASGWYAAICRSP